MHRALQLATIIFVYALWPLTSHAQFAPPNASPPGAPPGDVFGQRGTSAFVPATDQIQNSGLGVRILFVGRNPDGKQLTISAELQNLTEEPVYLALVGPKPAAVDSSGVTYELAKLAGLSQCRTIEQAQTRACIENQNGYLPGAGFSLLQPGSRAIVAATFMADQAGTSGFLSVTMNALLAKGTRPKDDRRKGDDNLTNVTISFPLAAIPEAK